MNVVKKRVHRAVWVSLACGGLFLGSCVPVTATTVDVELDEFTVTPVPTSAPAGSITFHVMNVGADGHEFLVIKTDLAPDALPTEADGSYEENGAGTEIIDEIGFIPAGGDERLTVELEAGSYVFICNFSREEVHYALGMRAAFTVEQQPIRDRANFVTHLEAAIDGTRLPHDRLQTVHEGRPLWVRYDLDAIRRSVHRPDARSVHTMWRCRELLPLPDGAEPVTLGETMTPLIRAERLGVRIGFTDFWIKDESRLPTGSFKSRGLAMAITMAKHFGVTRVAIPTAGNAGGAMAAYAARAGMEAYVFMPRDTPIVNQVECALAGAKTYLVSGLINDCGAIVRNGKDVMGWFDLSTLKEPYRLEGKKTMGLELAEQFGWRLPDVILYPTGGGTGLIGMWKAFNELRTLGWLDSINMPRMVAVQSSGCAPIPLAFERGERFAEPWKNAATYASGLRVPGAVGDFMILDAVRESGGTAIAVDEACILDAMRRATAAEGLSICPESATCVLAAEELLRRGWLKADEQVVLFNTGAGTKYIDAVPLDLPVIDDPHRVDYAALAR